MNSQADEYLVGHSCPIDTCGREDAFNQERAFKFGDV